MRRDAWRKVLWSRNKYVVSKGRASRRNMVRRSLKKKKKAKARKDTDSSGMETRISTIVTHLSFVSIYPPSYRMSYFKNCVMGLAIMTGAGSLSAQIKNTKKSLHEMTYNPWGNPINDTTASGRLHYDISHYPKSDTAHYGKNSEDLKWQESIKEDKNSQQDPQWGYPASIPPIPNNVIKEWERNINDCWE